MGGQSAAEFMWDAHDAAGEHVVYTIGPELPDFDPDDYANLKIDYQARTTGAPVDTSVAVEIDGTWYVSTTRNAVLTVTSNVPTFRRGDVNADRRLDLSDAVAVLRILFVGGVTSSCEDAADVNDDGTLDIADSVSLLSYMFAGGVPPAAPFGTCGYDTTEDDLDCVAFSPCQ